MNRLQALHAAEEHVARLLAPPLKPNGYPVDGWHPSTLTERCGVILRTAEFLWEPEPDNDIAADDDLPTWGSEIGDPNGAVGS